ncbi:MAG: hypothetical protein FWD43_05970 [Coriobacteriia bacterium]|nr:hypothetical protein [Coriobacteriia bacterium]
MRKLGARGLAFILVLAILIVGAVCVQGCRQADTPRKEYTGTVYRITDYYDKNGGFSALGQALPEENGEKVLTVQAGDGLIVGNKEYRVEAASLKISFYTQNSLNEVVQWWTDYCELWKSRGELS